MLGAVADNVSVAGDEGEIFRYCLCNQDAIEGIFMEGWQTKEFVHVLRADEERAGCELKEGIGPPSTRTAHDELALHCIDHYFPVGGNTEEV